MACKRNLVAERAAKATAASLAEEPAQKQPKVQVEETMQQVLDGVISQPMASSAEGWVVEFEEWAMDWAVDHKDASVAEIVQHMAGVYWYVAADSVGRSVFKKASEDPGELPLYLFWVDEVGWIAA